MNRREFFSAAFKKIIGAGLELLGDHPVITALEEVGQEKQRPPGAASEKEFQQLCTGCDACMIACPVNVIMIEDLEKRLPLLYPEKNPCLHCDGYPCVQACSTGALSFTNSLTLRSL